jgi:AcrR family transcriptional regulator
MDEIAERAGVSKPTLYQHFSGKLDLYLAVVHSQSDLLVGEVLQALRSTTCNRERLRAAVHAYFDFVDDDRGGFRLIFESDVVNEPSVQGVVDRAHDACVNAVHSVISDASAVDSGFARVLAVGLVGASQAAARSWFDAGCVIAKDDAVEAVVMLCWSGISGLPLKGQ